ncbi:MAG: sulfur carrier protein ThiS [Bacteroidetes bacterium]|nr:sulfur carrier protein ThiS [Bacteroidota bacterium]
MQITFNGEIIETTENKPLSNLLSEKNLLAKNGIAIALNSKVIPKLKWDTTLLNNNDKILVITATQGG